MSICQKFSLAFGFLAMFLLVTSGFSQTPTPTPFESYQEGAEKACTAQKISGPRTYSFRELPIPKDPNGVGWGGPKLPWYTRLFPFLAPKIKYGGDDIRALDALGKTVPIGETKRSFQLRTAAEQKLKAVTDAAEQKWQEWIAQHPQATPEEKKKAELELRFQGLAAAKLSRFDWRENGLDVGPVEEQGFDCNSCWAFASFDAMQMSRRLMTLRSNKTELKDKELPSVRQLMSCMLPKGSDVCEKNWHGDTFTYLMDKGLPLGGSRKYTPKKDEKVNWTCEAEKYLKALTWDYVSSSPQNIASPEEIKLAIVTYGAVVTAFKLDYCFRLYGDGVFNEEFTESGYHIVTIIGWDDEKSAWLIKNSYGTQWGQNGFGWMKYGSNGIGRFSAVIVADPDEEKRIAEGN